MSSAATRERETSYAVVVGVCCSRTQQTTRKRLVTFICYFINDLHDFQQDQYLYKTLFSAVYFFFTDD